MTTRLRRLGFGVAFAIGLALLALSFGGMASLDADLRAAAEQVRTDQRVRLDLRECDRVRRSDRET